MAFSFKFSADGTEFTKGLSKMKKEVKGFAKSAAGLMVGAFAGGKIISAMAGMVESAKDLNKQAKLFSTTTQVVQKFGKAAEASGFTLDNLADAMHDMTEKAQDAAQGNKNYADSFKMMNLDANDFMNMNFEEKVRAFGNGLKSASKSGLEFLAANDLAGGAAQKLIGTFKDGGDEFFKLAEGMNAATDAQINAGLKLGKTWREVKHLGTSVLSGIAQGLLKIGAIAMASADTLWVSMSETAKGLGERFSNLGDVIGSALTGNLDDAKDSFLKMGGVGDQVAKRIETRMKIVRANLHSALVDIDSSGTHIESESSGGTGSTEAEDALERQKIIEEKIKKLKKEVSDIDDKRDFERLKNAEKLLALEERKAALMKTMMAGAGQSGQLELDALEALKDLQGVEGKIEAINEDEKSKKDDKKAQRKLDMESSLADLRGERDSGQSDLKNLKAGGVDSSVIASSLRSIGGGGSAIVTRDPALQIAKRQEMILKTIAENTALVAREQELTKETQTEF